ncbi:dihydroxyacetone kinase subunit DhaL [Candidatus Chloroploca sp. Khr17]|uniref:dihydroxyacetone kinase subunit DhaL n=1 Tax=Candidatus Chloroploca sp. Khr17 TaxID=2496869 RepID=UPI001F115935|nr:dihydroxyacetone kinase subunit DhaL [Candidatus Chloroploca sp. Khr17]
MMSLTTGTLRNWLRHAAALIHEQRDYLTRLDAAIGDGDHGVNLDRGFTAIVESLAQHHRGDAGTILKTAAMRMIATVGGASGPLYGTAFRRAGKLNEGYQSLDEYQVLAMLQAFLDGVATLGKAHPGDKTMVDALAPAVEAYAQALSEQQSLAEALQQAAAAAHQGAVATIPLLARRGRAAYLGERAIGHQDPGATSAALLIQALAEVV